MSRWIAGLVFLLLLLPLPSAATGLAGLIDPIVEGNVLRAGLALPGSLTGDIAISFEEVEGLSVESLGLSVNVVSLLDLSLLARLGDANIPAAFPVLLRIEPPAQGGLSFRGVVSIDVHTHSLLFMPNTPLRLFAASGGGPFEDITASMGMGSYRARGRKGQFSEFLILLELRPVNRVINDKLGRIDQILATNEALVAPAVFADLTDLAAEIRAEHVARDTPGAIAKVEEFIALVESHSGPEIPDVWSSAGGVVNVGGSLQAAAETLRFSLILKRSQGLLGLPLL
jgi:hypothetical protein